MTRPDYQRDGLFYRQGTVVDRDGDPVDDYNEEPADLHRAWPAPKQESEDDN